MVLANSNGFPPFFPPPLFLLTPALDKVDAVSDLPRNPHPPVTLSAPCILKIYFLLTF